METTSKIVFFNSLLNNSEKFPKLETLNENLFMKRLLLNCSALLLFLLNAVTGYSQTTVSTALNGSSSSSASGTIVFGVTNNNTYAIAITTFSAYHNNGTQNTRTYSVWFNQTTSTATTASTINAANGWIPVGTSGPISTTSAQITPVLTNQYVVIPPNATYRIAIICNSGVGYYSTSGATTYSNGNVTIQTGNNTVNKGWAGVFPTPGTQNAYFTGSITFVQATPDNIWAQAIVSPISSPSYCANDSVLIRVALRNVGDAAQTNFPVTARYVGTSVATVSTTYTNTLAPFANDTITVAKINLPQGNYTIRAYTGLSTDTVSINDTTPSVNFSFRAQQTSPVAVSDTVCPGDNGSLAVNSVANTGYKWFSAPTNGTLINTGTSLNFTNVTQDTVMWVGADSANCLSTLVPIGVYLHAPPAPYLGPDTSFCATSPLMLDAGYPGATYLWNTGDTTQTILVTTNSGAYSVAVTQYCTRYDTINVTVHPLPTATGISYVRMNNTYFFQPSFFQNVDDFIWYFGDGTSSTDTTPIHTYSNSINIPLTVMLVVRNVCGEDTVYKVIPTSINDVNDDAGVKIYPNPVSDKLFLVADDAVNLGEVVIYNTLGKMMLRQQFSFTSKGEIDIRYLPAGNYIVKMQTDKGNISRPIQVTH